MTVPVLRWATVREVLGPRGSYLVAVTLVSILIVLVLPLAAYAQEELPPGIGDPPKGEPSKGVPTKEGPTKRGLPKEGPSKGGLPGGESPGDDKELLEAGGDLPLPQRSEAGDVPADGGGFSLWRVSGMILSGGVLVFAVYRLFLGPQ